MSVWIWSAAVLIIAAAMVWAFKYRASRALIALVCEKTGVPPKPSRLKTEWTPLPALERTLQNLSKRGFTTVFPQELHSGLPPKPVLLAFMGGYQSFFTEVFPLLQKYNAKACVFLAQEYVGIYNAWQDPYHEPWQNLLTEKQLKILAKSGIICFGAVDLKARNGATLPPEEALFGVQENIFRLKNQLGITAQAFAFWPAKKWDNQAAQRLADSLNGLPALTLRPGVNAPDTTKTFVNTLQIGSWRARRALWTRR